MIDAANNNSALDTNATRASDARHARIPARGNSIANTVQTKAKVRGRKAEILAEAARQFSQIERPGPSQINVFREFFYQLIDGCDKAERRRLSILLAGNVYVPRQIVIYLALDEKEVAAPVLLFSKVLNEADIVQLANRLPLEKLEILCRRDDLTEAAIAALKKAGGTPVGNLLARQPRRTAASTQIADAAIKEATLKTVTADVPLPVARKLLELASRGGRLGRQERDHVTSAAEPVAAPNETFVEPAKANGPDKVDGEQSLGKRLHAAARLGDRDKLAAVFGEALGCPAAPIADLLSERSIETLCVLLKPIEIDQLSATKLILLLRPQAGRSREALASALDILTRLDIDECREFIAALGADDTATMTAEPAAETSVDSGDNAFARAIAERRREVSAPVLARPTSRPAARGLQRPFGQSGLANNAR